MESSNLFCRKIYRFIFASLLVLPAFFSVAEEPRAQAQPQTASINPNHATSSPTSIIRYGKQGSTINLGRHTVYLEGITADDTAQAINGALFGGIASSALTNLGYIGLHLFSQPHISSSALASLVALAGAAGQSLWYYYQLLSYKQAAMAGVSYFLPLFLSQSPHLRLLRMFPRTSAESFPHLPRHWAYLLTLGLLPLETLLNAIERYIGNQVTRDVQVQLSGEVSRFFMIRARLLNNGTGLYILERMPQTQPEENSSGYQKLARVLEEQDLTTVALLPYTHKSLNKLKLFCLDKQTGEAAKITLRGDFGQEEAPWLLTSIARLPQSADPDHSAGVHSLLTRDVIEHVADAIKAFTDREKGDDGYNSDNFDEPEPDLYEYSVAGTDIGFLPQASKDPLRRHYGSNALGEVNEKITWDNSGTTTKLVFDDGIPCEDIIQWRMPGWLGNAILSEFMYWSQEAGYRATGKLFRTVSNMTGLTDFMHDKRRESARVLYQAAHELFGMNDLEFTFGMRLFISPFAAVHEDYINQRPMYLEVDTTPPMPYPTPTGADTEGTHCFRCSNERVNPGLLRLTSCCRQRICQSCLSEHVFNDCRNRLVRREKFLSEFSAAQNSAIEWNCSRCRQAVQGQITRWRTLPRTTPN